jgi:acyl carrier protein
MQDAELRAALLAELHRVAPDIEPATLDVRAPLRESVDLDSMDFLNLLAAIHARCGVEIPDADAGQLRTFADLYDYVRARLPRGG